MADIDVTLVEDKDWERAWMDDFHPLQFGERLWIVPSWHEAPDPDAANLLLDPGLAFGTGTHPTTALCLEWLDGQDVAGKQVTDYGCGSGILGLAALLLGGAEHVVGVDTDPPQAWKPAVTTPAGMALKITAWICTCPATIRTPEPISCWPISLPSR